MNIAEALPIEFVIPTLPGGMVGFVVDLFTLADTVIGVVPSITVDMLAEADANTSTMTALESITMRASSEEVLVFGRKACNFWPTTARNCTLHARMPSCHV